jgi:hypothetical protein
LFSCLSCSSEIFGFGFCPATATDDQQVYKPPSQWQETKILSAGRSIRHTHGRRTAKSGWAAEMISNPASAWLSSSMINSGAHAEIKRNVLSLDQSE